MPDVMSDVTVGVDIGTTSVKAVAVDGEGTVLARARVPHDVVVPAPDRLEHRPDEAWRAGVLRAVAEVEAGLAKAAAGSGRPAPPIAAVNVAAMVPSLCAVDAAGAALTPGLLYGDGRGADGSTGLTSALDPSQSGELLAFLRWCAAEAPSAAGFWPAQAVANHALGGEGVIDTVTAMTAVPVFDLRGWDPAVAQDAGTTVDRLPRVVPGDTPAGCVQPGAPAAGATLGAGTVDAFAEQLVAGADDDGDVLVICGTTLITWAVVPDWREVPGLWTVPHTAPGKVLVGGPSNAGGLFLERVLRLTGVGPGVTTPGLGGRPAVEGAAGAANPANPAGEGPAGDDPRAVPVWAPYIRGERTPLHDRARRAALHDLDLTHDAGAVRRAAYEAAGFVVRHQLDLAGIDARRIVATGGGVRSTAWMQALADATGLPVDVVSVPEGAALGAAFAARVVAGLEASAADGRRWARVAARVEPDPAWIGPTAERYARFRQLTAMG